MKSYTFTVIGAPVGPYEYTVLAESLKAAKEYGMAKFSTPFLVRPTPSTSKKNADRPKLTRKTLASNGKKS